MTSTEMSWEKKSQLPSSEITLPCRTDRQTAPSSSPQPLPYFVLCPSRGSPSLLTNPDPGDGCYQGGTKPRAGFWLLEEGSRRSSGLAVMLKAGLCLQPGKQANGEPRHPARSSAPGTLQQHQEMDGLQQPADRLTAQGEHFPSTDAADPHYDG